MIERVETGDNPFNIHSALGNVRDFTSNVDPDGFFEHMVQSGIERNLRFISRFLEEQVLPQVDDTLNIEISGTSHALLQKLREVPPFYTSLIFPITIEIVGQAGVATPEIREDLLGLFRAAGNPSTNNDKRASDLRNGWYAAEALGRLYKEDILPELLEYRGFRHYDEYASGKIGQPVELYNSSVLQGVMLGLGETDTPEGIKEIFSILTMRNQYQFYGGNPVLGGTQIYHREYASDLIDTAPNALSRSSEDTIRTALNEGSADEELADLLTSYNNQWTDTNYYEGIAPEALFKLVLPHLTSQRASASLKLATSAVIQTVVNFAPYGMKADLVDVAIERRIQIPRANQWNINDLRRKDQKLNGTPIEWPESTLSDQEVLGIIEEIDRTAGAADRGAIGSACARSIDMDSEDMKEVLAEVPDLANLVKPGATEIRLAAARRIQIPEVQKRLLQLTKRFFTGSPEGAGTVMNILVSIFKLNQDYAVRYLCEEVLNNRTADQVHQWKLNASRYLGLLGDERALPYLVSQMLYSPIMRDRYAAIEAIGSIGNSWAAEFLFDAFQETQYPNLKRVLIEALAGLKTEGVVDFLRLQAKINKDKSLDQVFVFALAKAGDKEVIERLTTALETNQELRLGNRTQIAPSSIAGELWRVMLPKARFSEQMDNTQIEQFRNVVRRLGQYTVRQLLSVAPSRVEKIGRFSINDYGYYEFYDDIVPLFDRLTALPVEEAQQVIDIALPDDHDFAQFLFAMLTPTLSYPTMRRVLNSERTHQVVSTLAQEEKTTYCSKTGIKALPKGS